MPVTLSNNGPNFDADDNVIEMSNSYFPTTSQFWVYNNRPGSTTGDGALGFYWVAIGF
jgi:hypothetical protein